jgi:hypothetical protein
MEAPFPFLYPVAPLTRRHGPRGYKDYESYRDWLRDEFAFRCVYCLRRETWGPVKAEFDIDHHLPRTARADLTTSYGNLFYCCHRCNLSKGSRTVPDPGRAAVSACMRVLPDGGVEALNQQGLILIDELDLDARQMVRFRALVIRTILSLWRAGDRPAIREWLGLPADLPDLARCKPPGGNARPQGIARSWHARRQRGEEPECLA